MSSFRVRPRFEHTIELDREAIRTRILASLAEKFPQLEVKSFPEFIGIHHPAAERRHWSPRLLPPARSPARRRHPHRGHYGPEIEIWSVFLYGYLITGLLGTFSGLYGCAQLFIGETAVALYVTGTMAILAGLLYLGAQLGQKLGACRPSSCTRPTSRHRPAAEIE